MKPNLQHAIERVERPSGSHEGVGRKKQNYHQACIMHVPDGSYHKPALPKKSPHCQAFTSLMGGECSQHWISHPTYQAPRRRQHMVVEQPCIPLGARNQPDHPRKRHGTYLPRRPRTNRKMDPVLAELLSVHVNTLEQWLANMAPNYREYTMPRKYMHNAAEEAQQMKRTNIGRRKANSQ